MGKNDKKRENPAIDEILKLADFHGFDFETSYGDCCHEVARAVTLEELSVILDEVLGDS